MITLILPENITKGNKDFVAVPKEAYEKFLVWQKNVKPGKIYTLTSADKKSLARARENFSEGKSVTLKQLRHDLGMEN
jgi:hypothetical protein